MGLCMSLDDVDVPKKRGPEDKQAQQHGKGADGPKTHIHRTNMALSPPKRAPERKGPLYMGGRIYTANFGEGNLRVFTYEELRVATEDFRKDTVLGEGGFGHVFPGWIDRGLPTQEAVAVKKLNTEGLQGHQEWMAEVDYLGQLRHRNLVRLIGYCAQQEQRLLVYEFMPRGSLENHLFRQYPGQALPWSTRMKVALGAAQGLAFLHEEAERQVIYRDFKASNILLDEDFTAKLSDFGLAKDGPEGDKTHVSTRVMGTYGYAAPEYVLTGHLTARSDVYSFGVVLLEMITGRRSMEKERPPNEQNLVTWAWPTLADRRQLFRLLDPHLEGRYSIRGATRACMLAAHCLDRDPKSRPLMSDVVETLRPLQDLSDYADTLPRPQPQPHPPAQVAAPPAAQPIERVRRPPTQASPRRSPNRSGGSTASAARQRQLQTAANMRQFGRTGTGF